MRLTNRYVKHNFKHVIGIHYCDIQTLEKQLIDMGLKMGHVERQEGWSSDVYLVNYDIAIVTGYNYYTCNIPKEKEAKILRLGKRYQRMAYNKNDNIVRIITKAYLRKVQEIIG